MPDYEEAIAQSMKHPPPPYYQVAMASEQVVPNINENQSVQTRATTHVVLLPTVEHGVPPAYDESGNIANTFSEPQNRLNITPTTSTNDDNAITNVNSLQRLEN